VSAHVAQWLAPSPFWPQVLDGSAQAAATAAPTTQTGLMQKPALLRFERDSFMDDVKQLLATSPADLTGQQATPITYGLPAPGEAAPPIPDELKLFGAFHGHHYLLAAALVCRMPGLPERTVDSAAGERVRSVLRRTDAVSGGEWAWVNDPASGKAWKLLAPDSLASVDPAEELLPLFPLRYADGELSRRMFVGLVPTASGDTFRAAGALSPLSTTPNPSNPSDAPPSDPRPAALKFKVTDPLRALVQAAADAAANPVSDPATQAAMDASQREASTFLLLDLAEYLYANLGWFATDPPEPPTDAAGASLWASLSTPAVSGGSVNWTDALVSAWSNRLVISGDVAGSYSGDLNLNNPGLSPDQLDATVIAALGPYAPPAQASPISIQGDVVTDPLPVAKLDAGFDPANPTRYVMRCVYQRPACGPLHPDVVSAPTDSFQIASFFDMDAPSRSIVIPMPVNTGIKDMRKLRKNVSFLLSNELRKQMNQVADLNKALKGQFASGDSYDLGLVCSFSIPIITICALLVLMLFISLLNIVFWWMPFLRICFPILRKAD
jgi:hypothetical protein